MQCLEYRCGGAPYNLQVLSVNNLNKDTVKYCFTLQYVGCAIKSPCCLKETDDVNKIEFASGEIFSHSEFAA